MQKLLSKPSELVRIFSFAGIVFLVHWSIMSFTTLYDTAPNIDIFFHFLGGFAIAHGFQNAISLFESQRIFKIDDDAMKLVAIIALTSFAATLWEFGEFSSDYLFGTHMQPSLPDTMLDLFLGLLGSLVSFFVFNQHAKQTA